MQHQPGACASDLGDCSHVTCCYFCFAIGYLQLFVLYFATREYELVIRFLASVCLYVCPSVCLCVCVCPVRAVMFKSLNLKTVFLVCRYVFKIFRSGSYVKVIGSRSGHRNKKPVCV